MIRRITLVVFALLFACLPLTAVAQEVPTDELQLWLRADAGTEATTGTPVAAWTDQSAHRRVLTQTDAARRPTYVADAIHGQPVLRFDADDSFDSAALSRVISSGSTYTVLRVTRQNDRGYVDVAEGQLAPDEDGTALQRFFRGQVAEVLVYDRRLSEAEKTTASTVLGERYRLAPGATTARSDDAAGGTNEGIRVHGAWTITVRNPDGSLDERRTFENALSSSGGKWISNFLAREQTVGLWTIFAAASATSNEPCEEADGSANLCAVKETGRQSRNWEFSGLNVSAPDSGPNEGTLVLQGSFTAQRSGEVAEVGTSGGECDPATSPDNCNGGSTLPMTSKSLPSAVTVSQGQQVNVKVVIGFQ